MGALSSRRPCVLPAASIFRDTAFPWESGLLRGEDSCWLGELESRSQDIVGARQGSHIQHPGELQIPRKWGECYRGLGGAMEQLPKSIQWQILGTSGGFCAGHLVACWGCVPRTGELAI